MIFLDDEENVNSQQAVAPGEGDDESEDGGVDLFEDIDEYIDPDNPVLEEEEEEELSEFQKEELRYKQEHENEAAPASKPPGGGTEDIDYATAPSELAKQKAWSEKRKKEKRWYIVHTYSGHENKVKVNLERRIESMNMQDKIFRVEVPQKSITKMKDGKRIEREERLFPGYVLVEMIMEDDSWYVVRHTPGVTKFVGAEKKPIPAKDSEIRRILMRSAPAPTKVQIDLKVGENVRIISGPFADFEGTVTEVSPEKEKLKATVSIFGRETPVELAFNQVVKL